MIKGRMLATFVILLVFCSSWSLCCAAMLEGRVVIDQEPAAGVKVFAYNSLDFTGHPAAIATP